MARASGLIDRSTGLEFADEIYDQNPLRFHEDEAAETRFNL